MTNPKIAQTIARPTAFAIVNCKITLKNAPTKSPKKGEINIYLTYSVGSVSTFSNFSMVSFPSRLPIKCMILLTNLAIHSFRFLAVLGGTLLPNRPGRDHRTGNNEKPYSETPQEARCLCIPLDHFTSFRIDPCKFL